jgi:hypothetical protein
MITKERIIMKFLLGVILLFPCNACFERRTQVKLEGGSPLIFNVSGSGNLVDLTVGIDIQDKSVPASKRSLIIWEIVPVKRDGEGLEEIGKITYGVVPEGYRQLVPAQGAPPPLSQGVYYYYSFATINAPQAWGGFEIINDKAKPVYGKGTCFRSEGGKEVEIRCEDQ